MKTPLSDANVRMFDVYFNDTTILISKLETVQYHIGYVTYLMETTENYRPCVGVASPLTCKVNKRGWFKEGDRVAVNGKQGMIRYVYANRYALVIFDDQLTFEGGLLNNNSTFHLDSIVKV